MNNDERLTWFAVALIFVIAGITVAYAETATIEVPFDSHGTQCTFDEVAIEYRCLWQGIPDKLTVENLEEFRDVLTKRQYDLALQDILEAIVIKAPVIDKPTPTERRLADLEEALEPSEATIETIKVLKAIKEICELGIEEGARLQQYAEFELVPFKPKLDGPFNLANYPDLKKAMLKLEECTYWNEYRAKYLAQYLDIDITDEQVDHRDMVLSVYTYPPSPSIDHSRYIFCNMTGVNLADYNCPRNITLPTGGVIHYQSDIYREYKQFLQGDESDQLRKNIIKANLEDYTANYGGR